MKRNILKVILLSFIVALNTYAQDPLVKNILSSLNTEKGLSVDFTLSVSILNKASRGTYYAYGKKFYIESDELKAWYNGKQLWVYLYQNQEINLSEPTSDEIAEINPLIALPELLSDKYSLTISNHPAGHTITATPLPKHKGSVAKATIKGDKKMPIKSIEIQERHVKEKLSIQVNSIKQNIKIPSSTFTYTTDIEPNIKVVDLR